MARRLGEKVARDAARLLQLLAMLGDDEEPMLPSELREASEMSPNRLARALSQLQLRGFAEKEGRGWRATPEGRNEHAR